MALKLTGEVPSVIQGLDGLGWLEEIRRNPSDPALTIKQDGSGSALKLVLPSSYQSFLELYAAATQIGYIFAEGGNHLVWKTVGGRDIRLDPAGVIDLRAALKNLGAANSGRVYVDDALQVSGDAYADSDLYLGKDQKTLYLGDAIGNRSRLAIPFTNNDAQAAVADEVYVLDTSADYSVVGAGTAGNQSHPGVVVRTATGVAWLAVAGIVSVDCDTGAVNRGDVLVTSNVTAKKAMANNAQTDPSKIIGVALTVKGSGSNGSVRALIKSY